MKIDYVVESNSDTVLLMYMVLKDEVKWVDNIQQGTGAIVGNKDLCQVVSLYYVGIEDKVVCFYEPTSLSVDWSKVEGFMQNKFPDAEDISATELVFKFKKEFS